MPNGKVCERSLRTSRITGNGMAAVLKKRYRIIFGPVSFFQYFPIFLRDP